MSRKTVTPADMRLAAEWLEGNEGEPDECDPMRRVADWLREQAEARELRTTAKKHGFPVAKLRAALSHAEQPK